jgi:hypothetical protein
MYRHSAQQVHLTGLIASQLLVRRQGSPKRTPVSHSLDRLVGSSIEYLTITDLIDKVRSSPTRRYVDPSTMLHLLRLRSKLVARASSRISKKRTKSSRWATSQPNRSYAQRKGSLPSGLVHRVIGTARSSLLRFILLHAYGLAIIFHPSSTTPESSFGISQNGYRRNLSLSTMKTVRFRPLRNSTD